MRDEMTKWTEGDWSHDEDEIFAKTEGGYVFVAETKPLPGDEGPDMSEQEVANARLIAAAPDLYEALALTIRTVWGDDVLTMGEAALRATIMDEDSVQAILAARSALACAQGSSNVG